MSEMTMYRARTDFPAFVAGGTLSKTSYACPNREAALLVLCRSKEKHIDRLLALSRCEWRKVLRWLDDGGLTLYFADRVNELNLQGALPVAVNQRLQRDLSDNRARMKGLLQESAALQEEFQWANVAYAVLDGFSLCPSSVPMSELRYQRGLEFLVNEGGASNVREVLEQAGYRVHEISGTTLKFGKNEASSLSTKNMYKAGLAHTVELHIEMMQPGRESSLSRREYREIEGVMMPLLAPADLFLRQGMRAFNDVCSSFLRASDLLEFYRNVCAHGNDRAFWFEVRKLAEEDHMANFGLGVVLQIIESVMQDEVPSKLAMWTMLRLPAAAQRWIDLYGLNCVYGTPSGTKLHLLLQRELKSAGMFFTQPAKTSISFRLDRDVLYLQSIFQWLRLHVVEEVRYGWASYRWRRYRSELSA